MITDGLLETYLFESNSLVEQLDELLLQAEQTGTFTIENVNEIFRSMHTIKGASAMMEFHPLTEIAHHIEDLFFEIREHGMETLNQEQKVRLFDILFRSTDQLRADLARVESGEALSEDVSEFVNLIEAFLGELKGSITKVEQEEAIGEEVDFRMGNYKELYLLHIFFEDNGGMEHLRAFIVVNTFREEGLVFRCYPEDVETNSEVAELLATEGFVVGFDDELMLEEAINLLQQLSNIKSYEMIVNDQARSISEETTKIEEKQGEPEEKTKKEEMPKPKETSNKEEGNSNSKSGAAATKQNLISVNLSKLDQLMAIVGEIVITESMVEASPELQGLKLDGFLKSARQLRKLTDDLQDIAMSLRMVTISGVFQKMNRIVRDMARELNKDVKLTISGGDTEIDKTIVDNIADPIMHIVRNAMDHGIEADVNERIAAGKNPQGEIILSAKHTGSEVVIIISNDGKELDTERILNKAEEKGLLVKPKEEYTEKEKMALIMIPGFSTNENVTQYSGRGVGMDVVKKNIQAVGGTISIDSEVGKGCCMTIKIPLTLAIVDGMEISVGGDHYTIPISSIRQSFKAAAEDIILDTNGKEMIQCMEKFLPVIRLDHLYQIPNGHQNIEDGILIWVETNEKSYCLFVDQLLGEQQVVVKPLPTYLNHYQIKNYGISGCTILGDGTISIILDIVNVFHAWNGTKEGL